MRVTFVCLQGNVEIIASDSLIKRSEELRRTLELFGGNVIYISEKYHPALVRSVIDWAEDSDTFSIPSDPIPIMALADDIGVDELVEGGAKSVCKRIRQSRCITSSIWKLIEPMTDPVRLRLLDYADPTSFQLLRQRIAPYHHQYIRQLENMLPKTSFTEPYNTNTARETYETVLKVRNNISAHIRNGIHTLDVRSRVDKVEISPHYHHLFTLERIAHTLITWDLLRRPFERVAICDSVVDASFAPSGRVFMLDLDGFIYGRSVQGEKVWSAYCGPAHAISTSRDFLLVYGSDVPPSASSRPQAVQGLWKWSSDSLEVNTGFLGGSVTACISPNGLFVVYYDRGTVRISPTDPKTTELARVLDDPCLGRDELGDILTFAISADSSTVAAVYVGRVKFWFLDETRDPLDFDLEERYGETFGYVSFSPDQQFIALGSWEGRVTLVEIRNGAFDVHSRLDLEESILHLAWCPDGQYLVYSSYSGAKFVDPWKRNTKARRPEEMIAHSH